MDLLCSYKKNDYCHWSQCEDPVVNSLFGSSLMNTIMDFTNAGKNTDLT